MRTIMLQKSILIIICIFLNLAVNTNVYSQVQIGTSTYSTLKAAFDAVNSGLHTGNITILITGNTTETQTAVLSAGNFTSLTIRPSGGSRTISGNIDGNLIEIYKSNVTIDGSLTPGGTSRDLSIANENSLVTYTPVSVVFAFDSNCTIKNTNIYNRETGTGISVWLYNVTNFKLENCAIYKSDIGLIAETNSKNVTITKCTVGSTTSTNKIRSRGIQIGLPSATWAIHVDGFEISNCTITGINNTSSTASAMGIGLFTGAVNGRVTRNLIYDIKSSYSTASAFGMYVGFNTNNTVSNSGNITIDNNFITDYYSQGGNSLGIVFGYIENGYIYHNTISAYGTSNTAATSGCIWINPNGSSIRMKNNIFRNTLGSNGGFYTICVLANLYNNASPFTELDYNNYFISVGNTSYIGVYYPTNCATLTDWKNATNAETNGVSRDVNFVSNTDLHLNGVSVGDANIKCPAISGYTLDIDNESRVTGTGNTTYMGADEVKPTLTFTQNINQLPGPICEGSGFTLQVNTAVTYADNVNRNYTVGYEWYKLPSTTPIEGATSRTYTKTNTTIADAGTYYARAKYAGININSNQSTVTIHKLAEITKQPDQYTYVCAGLPFDFPPSVETRGTVVAYQWQKENPITKQYENIPGQNKSYLDIQTDDATQLTGKYRVVVTGGVCNTTQIISTPTEIIVSLPLVSVSIMPDEGINPEYLCYGDEIRLIAEGVGTVTGYQWEKMEGGMFIPIRNNPTANQRMLIIPNSTEEASGLYRCRVFGSANCYTPELITEAIDVKVWSKFEFYQHPEHKILCRGENFELTVVPGGEVIRYQWQKDGEDIDPLKNPSALTPTLQISNADFDMSGVYRCMLTVEDCRGIVQQPSNEVLVYVLTEPAVTHQPKDAIVDVGGTATFEVKAHVYNLPGTDIPVEKHFYEWYKGSLNQPLQDNDRIAGARSSILTIRKLTPQDYRDDYFVVVLGKCGGVVSEFVGIKLPPDVQIISHPQSQLICEGQIAVLNVTAVMVGGGTELKYQWFKDGYEINDGGRISGAKTEQLVINNFQAGDVGTYSAMVSVMPGSKYRFSNDADLGIKLKPFIVLQPEPSIEIAQGRELIISVEADGFQPLSYQWFKDDNELPGETNSTLTIPAVTTDHEGSYYCQISNECGIINSNKCVVTVSNSGATNVTDNIDLNYLSDCLPNPVSSKTMIKFSTSEAKFTKITLSDIFGKHLLILFEGFNSGLKEIIIDTEKISLPTGIYFYTMQTDNFVQTKKMILIK